MYSVSIATLATWAKMFDLSGLTIKKTFTWISVPNVQAYKIHERF